LAAYADLRAVLRAGRSRITAPLRGTRLFGGAGVRSSDPKKPAPLRNSEAERAAGPQFAFIAATPQDARAIRPQLRFQMTYDLPIYATSDAWDPSVRTVADMDGLVFPEMPWILHSGQGAPELWDAIQQEWSAQARGRVRLYAFGFDAYRLALQLRGNASFIGVSGLTGTLTVGHDGRVQRSLEFARRRRDTAAGNGECPSMFLPEPP
jgi:outer membrane PBP1 activator LpoA protein